MFTEGSLSVHRVFTECSLSESQMKAKPSNPLGQKSELLRYDWSGGLRPPEPPWSTQSKIKVKPSNPLGQKSEFLRYDWSGGLRPPEPPWSTQSKPPPTGHNINSNF